MLQRVEEKDTRQLNHRQKWRVEAKWIEEVCCRVYK